MKYKLKLDYTEEQLKELKRLGNEYYSPISAIHHIVETGIDGGLLINLWRKYKMLGIHKEFDFMADVNNAVMGTAIFPEPKKYYVHLFKGDEYSYLNINPNGGAKLYNRLGLNGWKVKFTRDEVIAIDPRLVPFMEEVEE